MVLPEGRPPTDRPGAPGLAMVGGAIVIILATIFVLGRLTAPPEGFAAESTTTSEVMSIPTTTTTLDLENFSVTDIATGDRFIWFRAPRIGSFWPIGLVYHHGALYLFGANDLPYADLRTGGLRVWASKDGIVWSRPVEVIGPDHRATAVTATENTLVVMGNRQDDDFPVIWTSTDGSSWEASQLPVPNDWRHGVTARLSAAAGLGEGMVVLGDRRINLEAEIASLLPDDVAPDGTPYALGFFDGPEGRGVYVSGPLGIVGYRATFEELGIDDETASGLLDPSKPHRGYAWVTTDAEIWDVHEVDTGIVEQAWSRFDGTIIATGFGRSGSTLWSSPDGLNWDDRRAAARLGVSEIRVWDMWGDLLIGSDYSRDLFQSHDGIKWQALGTGDLLPEQLDWSLHPVAAGSGGLAAIATTWDDRERLRPAPVILDDDSHTLTLDLNAGTLTLSGGGDPTITHSMGIDQISDLITVDFVSREVVFLHPETGDPMASFDFASLEQAEQAAFGSRPNFEKALLFKRYEGDWTLQALSRAIGPESEVPHMAVLEDRVILVTYTASALRDRSEPPEITIRVGVIGPEDSG